MRLFFTVFILIIWGSLLSQDAGDSSYVGNENGEYVKDTATINNLLKLSKKYAYENMDSALYYAFKALKLSRELKAEVKEAFTYLRIGDIWSVNEIFDSSIYYYNLSLNIYKAVNDKKHIAGLTTRIGYSYYYSGHYDKALEYFTKVVEIYEAEGDKQDLASAYNNLSACYNDLGKTEEAYHYLLLGLKINEDIQDKEGIAGSLINLGTLESGMGNHQKAIDYYNKALKYYAEIDSKSGQSMCYNNLGDSYSSLGKYKEALDYFQKSLEIDIEQNDDYGIAIDENNIADHYLTLGDTAKALKEFKDVLKFAREKGFNKVISTVSYNLAELYFNKGNYAEAVNYGRLSEKYARMTGTPGDILDASKILSDSYGKMGDFENAYRHLKDYQVLYDSLFTAEKSKQILEIEAKYESEKKEQENQLLIKKNETDRIIKITLSGLLIIAVIFIFTLYRLIHIKKKSERKLAIQKSFYEKLLGNSQDFIVVVDKDMNIKYISPSIENKIGRKPEDRVGKSVLENVHPDDRAGLAESFGGLLKEMSVKFEFRLSDVSGKYLNMAAYAKNLFDDPNIQGVIVNFWDITEIRKTEKALKIANDTKDKIFSIISHDLRGPISTSKSIIDLVVNEFDNLSKDAIRDLLTTFKPTADATYFLLENLLSWAMNQMGKLKFDPGLNPVKPIVDANIDLYISQAESKDIKIVNAINENLIGWFDKGMIDIVIRNFVSNAVKFTPKGGEVRIDVKKSGDFLKVEVSDTGIGMDDNVVRTLFDPDIENKQLSQGTDNEKGAGIGLMICKEFVELNGGSVGVESHKGKGSVFFFTIPANKKNS